MARTTLNLDDPVLADLKRLQRKEGKPLGDLASELLATAIAARKSAPAAVASLRWTSRAMGVLVDLSDKDALFAAMESSDKKRHRRP